MNPYKGDKLSAFGSNGSSQLGLQHAEDTSKPARSNALCASIKQIAAGGNHSLVLSDDGTVASFGDNTHGQCVSHQHEHDATKPNGSQGEDCIGCVAQVSATWTASILLRGDGTMLACGEGLNGELGLGVGTTHAVQTRQVLDFPPSGISVVQIASCMAHTVAVLSNGEVFGWGKGRQGQLGSPAEIVWSPRRIEGLHFSVAKAVCGKDFTCLVGDKRSGGMLVLGHRKSDRFSLLSSVPPAIPGWKDVAASWGSILVLKDNGELLGFGRNDHGQLPPPGLPPIEAIAAGSEHCIALTKAGKVLAWGWGEHGNCGVPTDANGDVKGRWNEIEVAGPVKAVFAGCATSFVVADGAEQDGAAG